MTKLLTTVALVALIASPALAAKAPARHGKLLLQAAPATETTRDAGWDPDPNVRLMLRKDDPKNFY